MSERERETDRQTDRQTDTERDRQTDRQRHRQTDRQRVKWDGGRIPGGRHSMQRYILIHRTFDSSALSTEGTPPRLCIII